MFASIDKAQLRVIHLGSNEDLPESVKATLPDAVSREIFRRAFNQHAAEGRSEMHSYLKAYRSLEESGYSRGEDGAWKVIQKDSPTVGDVHVNRPLGSDKKQPEEEEEIFKRISGNSDIPLNYKGQKLAERLGERIHLKGGLDVLYNSPLQRAVQTAAAIKSANPATVQAQPDPALQPWHLGRCEGKMPDDVHNLIAHYIENPDEQPPGKGADGTPAETFHAAVNRQLDRLSEMYTDCEDHPNFKVGTVMHSRGMELLQAWVDAGCPEDYELDTEDLLNPDDPDHATMLRWHNGKVKEIDLEDDDELKPGLYLILHSLTDDDTDDGNDQLEKADLERRRKEMIQKLYLPPLEVHRAAKSAWEMGTAVLDITSPLAENSGLSEKEIRRIVEHFAAIESATESGLTRAAWGGELAAKWAGRVLKKIAADIEKYDPDQSRDDHGRWGEGNEAPDWVTCETVPDKGEHTGEYQERYVGGYRVADAWVQKVSDETEAMLSKALGIPRTGDNQPFDCMGKGVGIEVKTLLYQKNDKITMSRDAIDSKLRTAKENNLKTWTVVVDKRGAGRPAYYVRQGVGSFRLHTMERINSLSTLKSLVRG